jgi:hypothetical protein
MSDPITHRTTTEGVMRKTTQKQQRRSSTDSLIKTGKKRDIELAEDELNQVTGGETKGAGPIVSIDIESKTYPGGVGTKGVDLPPLPTKSKY